MSEHTPGPWTVEPNDGAYVKRPDLGTLRIEDEDGLVVAIIVTDCPRLDQEAPANARLIAAAPDLLAACREILHALTGGDEASQAHPEAPCHFLWAAIAKAQNVA